MESVNNLVSQPINMTCSLCVRKAPFYCSAKVLGKYNIQYYRCERCQFIFTENPYWLEEAYSSAISGTDVGIVWRNEQLAPVVQAVISQWFDIKARFIDYGGGYGLLVRMMRDRGLDFYRQDKYCENLFAKSFDIMDVPPFRAELLTAFEVFEHLTDPVTEIEKMLDLADNILFSTDVQPMPDVTPENWWYFSLEGGQHVSLYSRASLAALATRFKMHYVGNGKNIHLFSKRPINNYLFKTITHPRLNRWYNRLSKQNSSLIPIDFQNAKAKQPDTQSERNV